MADGRPVPDEGLAPLRRLWGEIEPATRGRPARLTLREIVDAGLDLADDVGVGGITIAAVADRIGAGPMSLYRHVGSKDELLALLEDAGVGTAPQIDMPIERWRDALRDWSAELRSVYARRPWLLFVPTQGPPAGPGQLAWLEVALHALRGFDIGGAERIAVVTLLSGHVRNAGRIAEDTKRSAAMRDSSVDRLETTWSAFLAERLTAERFPALSAAMADIGARATELATWDDRQYMIERVLDAIEGLAPARWSGDAEGGPGRAR